MALTDTLVAILSAGVERVFESRDPGRLLGLALAWDGVTEVLLPQRLDDWGGVSTPSVLDLASLSPNGGIYTRRLLWGAAHSYTGGYRRVAETYRRGLRANVTSHLRDVVKRLYPRYAQLTSLKYGEPVARALLPADLQRQYDISDYAQLHFLTTSSEAFDKARQAFRAEMPAPMVDQALRTGICACINALFNLERLDALDANVDALTTTHTAAIQIMELVFRDGMFPTALGDFRKGLGREMQRFHNADLFAVPAVAAAWNPAGIHLDGRAVRRGQRLVRAGHRPASAKREMLLGLGLAPADKDLFRRIVFPRQDARFI